MQREHLKWESFLLLFSRWFNSRAFYFIFLLNIEHDEERKAIFLFLLSIPLCQHEPSVRSCRCWTTFIQVGPDFLCRTWKIKILIPSFLVLLKRTWESWGRRGETLKHRTEKKNKKSEFIIKVENKSECQWVWRAALKHLVSKISTGSTGCATDFHINISLYGIVTKSPLFRNNKHLLTASTTRVNVFFQNTQCQKYKLRSYLEENRSFMSWNSSNLNIQLLNLL